MELKLQVIQGQDLLGSNSSVIVDVDVFSIGRGNDNSWILPDPKLHISNKHCVIHRKNDEYHLTDISTNGVYLNGSSDPLGRGRSQVLKQGDQLSIGEYRVQAVFSGADVAPVISQAHGNLVEEVRANDLFSADITNTQTAASDRHEANNVLQQVLAATSEPEEDAVSKVKTVDELLGNDSIVPSNQASAPEPTMSELLRPISPEKAYYAPPKVSVTSAVQEADYEQKDANQEHTSSTVAIPDNWLDLADGKANLGGEATPADLPTTPEEDISPSLNVEVELNAELGEEAKVTADVYVEQGVSQEQAKQQMLELELRDLLQCTPPVDSKKVVPEQSSDSVEANSGQLDLLALMVKEAGLPEHLLQGKDPTELARQMGRMLRNFAQGAIDTLATRSMVKSEFRLQQTMIRPTDNNPLKLSPSGAEALKLMLMADSSAYLSADSSIQESFKDIQAHQLAMMSGIQAAFSHLLYRFEPQKLEQKFASRPRYSKGILGRNKTDLWREYQDYYHDICAMMEDEFQDLFSNEFGKAYENQLRKLR